MGDHEELFAAIQDGDFGAVQELVQKDQLLAAQRSEVEFFEAVALGRIDRVEELTRTSPGLIGQHAPDGFTGLHLAAFFGHAEVIEVLLSYGADPDAAATGSMDVRPIHSAAAGRKPESIVPIVQALLSRGVGINRVQKGGFTALHAAAAAGNENLLRFLLEQGADAGAKTDDGKSAFDLADEKGHELCAEILKAHSG